MHLGKAIILVRRELGISQSELAEKCSVSQPCISRIEHGHAVPSYRTLKKICEVFDVPESILYILGMEESDVPKSKKHIYDSVVAPIKKIALVIVSSQMNIEISQSNIEILTGKIQKN